MSYRQRQHRHCMRATYLERTVGDSGDSAGLASVRRVARNFLVPELAGSTTPIACHNSHHARQTLGCLHRPVRCTQQAHQQAAGRRQVAEVHRGNFGQHLEPVVLHPLTTGQQGGNVSENNGVRKHFMAKLATTTQRIRTAVRSDTLRMESSTTGSSPCSALTTNGASCLCRASGDTPG